MPPKAKNTREMVVDAAFAIAREQGAENINARTVSQRLGCSTQPVMYHFSTIEELKRAVYEKTDWYHTEYLMNIQKPQDGVMLGIGMNYIRFAIKEPNLFRFLFQSGYAYSRACEVVETQMPRTPERDLVLDFIRSSKRGILKPFNPKKQNDEVE